MSSRLCFARPSGTQVVSGEPRLSNYFLEKKRYPSKFVKGSTSLSRESRLPSPIVRISQNKDIPPILSRDPQVRVRVISLKKDIPPISSRDPQVRRGRVYFPPQLFLQNLPLFLVKENIPPQLFDFRRREDTLPNIP